MKYFTKRIQTTSTVICYFAFILFLIISCKNKANIHPNCGCESETSTTIPNTENLVGKLFFKNDTVGNNFNNQKYWIVYVDKNCVNCVHNLIVCNEEFLSPINHIPTLKHVNDIIGNVSEIENGIDVKFSGELKFICNPIFAPGDYTYENIILTSIELK